MPFAIENQQIISRAVDLSQANLSADSVALLSADHAKYFGLEGPAARIWQLLAKPITFQALVQLLLEEYQVDESRCRDEVGRVLAEMRAEGLIKVS